MSAGSLDPASVYFVYFFSHSTVSGHACSVAFMLPVAFALPFCARRNPWPAPSKMCGSYVALAYAIPAWAASMLACTRLSLPP